ncbi:MAG TPA: YncE family protein, partial [Rhodanobacter sp.]
MQLRLSSFIPALLMLACLPQATMAVTPAPAYQVLSRLPLTGAGGWDYLSFDAQHRHLFVSRGDRVLVIDVDQEKHVGTIANTQGVHGIAIAPDLQRGYTSDGKSASVTVFDLDTLKTVATITGTGEKPDAIVYDSASHHVFTF